MKRISASARWTIPIIVLLLALLLTACERPLQEVPAESESPATPAQPGAEPAVPLPPTPALPAGGEELPPVLPEGGEGETLPEGVSPPTDGAEEGAGDQGDTAGEGETPAGEEGSADGLSEDGTYTVQSGDTLYKIATNFGLTVDELATANGIVNVNTIDVGQVLTIPSATGAGDETAVGEETPAGDDAGEGEEQTYIVKPGDILGRIAQQFGVTAADLAAYNEIEINTLIYPGDELRIPPPGWTAPEQ